MDNKFITPTDKGIRLSRFLDKAFPNLINLNYTKELEEELDKIATGKMKYLDFLNEFYNTLETSAIKVVSQAPTCPKCGKPLALRKSKYGKFWGCTGYPNCTYIKK